MENVKKDIGLILAIVFASSVVSGSLVFFGLQIGGNEDLKVSVLDTQIDEAIERYVEKKQQEAKEQQAVAAADEAKKSAELAVNVDPVTEKDHVFGNENAKISLIEYSDFQCPYCRRFHDIAKSVVDAYGDDVNWVYRHYPLEFHEPAASLQAVAGECVAELGGNDKFWEFADKIFESNLIHNEELTVLAGDLGLDGVAFATCLDSGKYDDLIQKQLQNGIESGVKGTPGTIILNNETGEAFLVSGAQPLTVFANIIDGML